MGAEPFSAAPGEAAYLADDPDDPDDLSRKLCGLSYNPSAALGL